MKRRAFLASALLAPLSLRAQARFPERPVRLVVPFAPGGDGDIIGRLWARYATPHLGTSIVVDNRAGAGGVIGAVEVARARPDGYTLLLGTTTTQIISPAASSQPPYDAVRDFTLIGIVSITPTCIVVNPALGVSSLKELVALIRAHPGKYSYGSAGAGTITNLTGELLKLQAGGLDMQHVPYKGGAPALQDLIAGHIPITTPILTSAVLAQHRAGRARILGVNSSRRLKAAPDLPTSIEGGVPEMRVQVFNAIFAPAGMPRDILRILDTADEKARAEPGLILEVEKAGAEAFAGSETERQFYREEAERWTAIVRKIGFKTE